MKFQVSSFEFQSQSFKFRVSGFQVLRFRDWVQAAFGTPFIFCYATLKRPLYFGATAAPGSLEERNFRCSLTKIGRDLFPICARETRLR